jgi:hypothetical protein
VALLVAFQAVHPDRFEFRPASFDRLAAGAELREAILGGQRPADVWRPWSRALARFREQRHKYLLY